MINTKDAADAAVAYQPLRTEGSRAFYIGVSHSDVAKDLLTANSNAPKRSANSYGNRRASLNLVRTIVVNTPDGETETKDMKFELVTSVPVGASDAQVEECRARLAEILANPALIKDIAVVGKTQQ